MLAMGFWLRMVFGGSQMHIRERLANRRDVLFVHITRNRGLGPWKPHRSSAFFCPSVSSAFSMQLITHGHKWLCHIWLHIMRRKQKWPRLFLESKVLMLSFLLTSQDLGMATPALKEAEEAAGHCLLHTRTRVVLQGESKSGWRVGSEQSPPYGIQPRWNGTCH